MRAPTVPMLMSGYIFSRVTAKREYALSGT
jgi:hypothetical protein